TLFVFHIMHTTEIYTLSLHDALPISVSGVLSAAVIAGISAAVGLLPWQHVPNCLGAAAAGMFFDSILGASLERQGRIGNDAVNLLSTLLAAILAAATVPFVSAK